MVYLDNAATTALDPQILDSMVPYMGVEYGNASSVHTFGRTARMAVERARQQVADALGSEQKEIIFTSSASEANNLAIKGVIEQLRFESVKGAYGEGMKHEPVFDVVASPIEHPCVMETLKHLEKLGWIRVIWLPVTGEGVVTAEAVRAAISDRTVLVTVMYVNNEIGSIMPIQPISAVLKEARKKRIKNNVSLPLYFHCDAVQAVQYFDCNVNTLSVDLLSATAHKVYGPKGVGVLYVRDGVALTRQIDGGGQEYYKRAGTENVAGIVGAGEAFAQLGDSRQAEFERLKNTQGSFIDRALSSVTGVSLTGPRAERAPHITSFFFENIDAEALIIALDRSGFAVSSGSACSSGVVRQSHVISALGMDESSLKKGAAVRISMGKHTTSAEIALFCQALPAIVAEVRQFSSF